MFDNQDIMLKFVKIVEKYPEVYNNTSKAYKSRFNCEKAWAKITSEVQKEINEECTAEELKSKWRGIRCSFIRFKKRLRERDFERNPCKKYYLYDSLRFLDKFTEPNGVLNSKTVSESSFDGNNSYAEVDCNNSIEFVSNVEEWNDHKVSPVNEVDSSDSERDIFEHGKLINRKYVDKAPMRKESENNEDIQFYKSILPDIKNFTSKEKRKLKMGILQLIDEIEDDRKRVKLSNEVSSY